MIQARARLIERNGVLSPSTAVPISNPKEGEVLLRIHATCVNFHDLIGIAGGIESAILPRVPFSDASAEVMATGAAVENVQVGDWVIPSFYPAWLQGPVTGEVLMPILGDQIDGTLQTHLTLSARSVARAPKGLSHEENATLGCAALTAWRSLFVEAKIQPGQTVLLQGTGGVSLAALAFAKHCGARVIITSSSDEKLARAKALGADTLINYRTDPDWAEAVLGATGGVGADLVLDMGGAATLAHSVRAVKVGGHISVIGVLTGMEVERFPLFLVMAKNITLRGITVGSVNHLDAMCRAIEANGYRPTIDSVYDFDHAHQAVAALSAQQHFGKIVVRIP